MLQLRATSTEYQLTRLDVSFRLVAGRAHPGEIFFGGGETNEEGTRQPVGKIS